MIGSGCCNCAFFLFLQCPASEQDCMNVDSLFPPFSTDELFLLKQQEKIKEVVGRPKSALRMSLLMQVTSSVKRKKLTTS
jgi:polysaccharide pyruvyl transferase WcaK-like protein